MSSQVRTTSAVSRGRLGRVGAGRGSRPFASLRWTRDGRRYNPKGGLNMSTFSGTGLPPIARVGNSADAIQAIGRDTSLVALPVRLVRTTVIRLSAPTADTTLEFVAGRKKVESKPVGVAKRTR